MRKQQSSLAPGYHSLTDPLARTVKAWPCDEDSRSGRSIPARQPRFRLISPRANPRLPQKPGGQGADVPGEDTVDGSASGRFGLHFHVGADQFGAVAHRAPTHPVRSRRNGGTAAIVRDHDGERALIPGHADGNGRGIAFRRPPSPPGWMSAAERRVRKRAGTTAARRSTLPRRSSPHFPKARDRTRRTKSPARRR